MSKKPSLRIVLVDSERPVKILLDRELPSSGTLVVSVRHTDTLEDRLRQEPFDLSQVDFEMPGVGRVETRHRRSSEGADTRPDDGEALLLIDCLPAAKSSDASASDKPATDEILQAEILAALGADEDDSQTFLTRPLQRSALRKMVTAEPPESLEPAPRRRRGTDGLRAPILGESDAMRRVMKVVDRIAASAASVLIHGETGTGKTMVARRIHDLSPRADQRFVAINCSAFQEQLLESELFGHEKGSFTGATQTKTGLFEVADGGTLFLDEIGDMSAAMQAKLLQVLDDGEYRRVGGTATHTVKVRVVAASNKDLQQEVRQGRFREDLLFRLNVIHLAMPPLRDRRADIPTLIEHFLDRYRLPSHARKQISPEATQILMSYAWPGNVRELANTIEGLTLLAPGDEIRAEDLPPALRPRSTFQIDDEAAPLPMKEVERLHIQRALHHTEGRKAPAARLLGIDIKTLNAKIERYEIVV